MSINEKERAQTKHRNLLTLLRDFQVETLRFLEDKSVPFTNNQGENDLRMTKLQEKMAAFVLSSVQKYLLEFGVTF